MKFTKADPQQARLKLSMYGPPGSGKTLTSLLLAEGLAKHRKKRIAYIDTERGTDFYAKKVPERRIHPEPFDFDAIYTKSLADVSDAIFGLGDEHGIVVIDSMSHIWDAAMEAYEGRKTSIGSIPMNAWSQIKRPYKKLIDHLIGSKLDVIICGRQKNVFEKDDEKGEMTKVGVAMRAEGETAYEPHICVRMETEIKPDDKTQLRSRVVAYFEKDRTGILSGRAIPNPSFATFEPILALLGDVQAPSEDGEERAARDAELMARDQEEKDKSKLDKSVALFRDFSARLASVTALEALGLVSNDMKKSKRYLTEEHEGALRELLNAARDRIVGAQVKDM